MSHHHRPDSATCSGCTNIKKLLSTLLGIDVGVFLEGHQHISAVHHHFRDVAVQIELATNHNIRASDLSDVAQ